ncbi:glycosyltransferase family 25 protein [Acinetobacter sp. B10A]|uniref:glycosyltransferase family 25 protein n=1 Tax=Acinetobacter baretiae TaxID=2605383 RepID=UPI001B3C9ADC|nr:glycosyltransferase family 25 protein [Acinetobacter baretiae]MBF7685626.1 glycosyltransferase family 25 protein [Acinetobacter baretiae]
MYVLSLKSDHKRRDKISSQLKLINKEFEFFDAYTPKNIPENILNKANMSLTNGEKACAYSHLMIYKDVIEKNKSYGIILEDDAVLNNDFMSYFKVVQNLHEKYDVVIFGYSKVDIKLSKIMKFVRPSIKIKIYDGYVRLPYKQWNCGTVGYSISKSGAKKILGINSQLKVPADYWSYFEKNGVSIVHFSDILVTEDFINFESHLEADRGTFVSPNILLRLIAGFIRHFSLPFRYISWKKNFPNTQ